MYLAALEKQSFDVYSPGLADWGVSRLLVPPRCQIPPLARVWLIRPLTAIKPLNPSMQG